MDAVIKRDVIVLSANRYQMVDQQTGEIINEGCTVRFIFSDNLNPYQEEDAKGYRPGKASLTYKDFDTFSQVPGVYNCDVDIRVASDGTAKAVASNFKFVKGFGSAGK